jgi:chromosome condensin MukBEF ATPase and DNA-binding subunit MukB
MEVQELEAKIAQLEKRVVELSTSVSVDMEWLAEIRQMLQQLLAVLEKRTRQELGWDKPKSALESSSSSFPKSKSDAMLEKCVNLIFKDYEDQFKE